MKFTKPAWVTHQDAVDKKRVSIFSVHVHPDGTRIATGGLDAKVRIWATLPILKDEFEATAPKSLCTLTMHSGPVLTVRWTHSGKWLASGSDDTVVMIWDLDPSGAGKVWGTDETNIEGWRALKRLPGHESDVTDLAWSPDDKYLASVGLDSKVMIWCGYSLELLRKLDLHQGFVKGVTWDPVGQFLATQSDDKSVKVWRTTDWGLEVTITKPFEDSPGSTFFRRLSWSPDGAHITASNAMNNNGYVFVAAVISRQSWTSDISLVGHENTVEVAAYNPHIFLRRPKESVTTANICSVVALGSDDLTVSIWQTKSARPLIVAKDVFERPVLDLAWSDDGLVLYACSSDGSIGVFEFEASELDGIAPHSAQAEYLKMFNFVPPPHPYFAKTQAPHPQMTYGMGQQPQPIEIQRPQFISPPITNGHVNGAVVVSRDPGTKVKRRIQPVFVSSLPGGPPLAGPSYAPSTSSLPPPPFGANGYAPMTVNGVVSHHPYQPHMRSHQAYPPSTSPETGYRADKPWSPYDSNNAYAPRASNYDDDDIQMIEPGDVQIDAFETNGIRKGKRRATEEDDTIRPLKARTLGGDRPREAIGPVKELRPIGIPNGIDVGYRTGSIRGLEPPTLKTYLSCKGDEKEGYFMEGMNHEDEKKPPEVKLWQGTPQSLCFLDYLPSPALLAACSDQFCAVAMEDCTVNVYTLTGRRLVPTILLDSPCCFFEGNKCFLMAITASARLYLWNMKTQKAAFPSVQIEPFTASPNSTIHSAQLRSNGSPLIILSTGVAWSFDPSLLSWLKVGESRWSEGSNSWEGKQRASANKNASSSRGIISSMESALSELKPEGTGSVYSGAQVPEWWAAAMTLGHLESRLHAAKLLDSATEYRTNMILYARRIADEGFRAKGEELLKELRGPLYNWKPSREEPNWSPTILGLQKRDLLREVITIFMRSKTLAKLGQDWHEMLKRAVAEESTWQ